MRRISMLSTLCILASLLVSGPLTTGAPALASLDSPARTTVQGVFTDAVTGEPVAGACISLYQRIQILVSNHSPRVGRACSDANGAYSLPDIPTTSNQVAYLEAPGYGGQWYPGYADSSVPGFLVSAAPVTTRNIPLKRATAGLSVHLTRQDGSPAPYAAVSLLNYPGISMIARMQTDANGDASRTDIPAGDYTIQVTGAGYGTQYYPGKKLLADGQLVKLAAGSTLSLSEQFLPVDPMPALPAPATLSGTVRALDGTPIAGATVTTRFFNATIAYGTASTDSSGAYTIYAPGSAGSISVSAPGYATVWNTDDPLPVLAVAMSGTTRDFVLRPGSGTIRGTLTDSVPGPIPAFTRLTVTAADGWAYAQNVGYDGTFEIPNMPPGTYTLTIAPPGRQNQQIENVIVRDGEVTTADAQLLDPGRIRARVVDDVTGQPITGATVTATGSQSRMKVTDANGYAELTDYGVSDSVQVSATHKPYHFDPQPQTVHPTPGTVTDVTLRMTLGAVLNIPIVNANPAYGICLSLVDLKPLSGWTNGDCAKPTNGLLTFGPLPSGTYRAFLDPNTYSSTGAQWVSDSGGTGEERMATQLRLTAGSVTGGPEQHLGPAGSITGKAVDPQTHEIVQGCVRVATRQTALDSCTSGDTYRIDGLGPYAWPLFFESANFHGSIWSGGATTRLDAKLVPVTAGQTTYYDFAPGSPVYFDVQGPADAQALSVSVYAYDAQTGDPAGSQWASSSYSNIGPGPKLLLVGYTDPGGNRRSCWMNRPARLRSEQPNGVYYGGSWEHQTPITVVPGKNCLPTMPPIVRITPAPGNMKPMFPNQPATPRQAVSASGRSAVAGAPSITATEPESFNELVRNSFDSALQLAIGVLP